MQGLEFDPDIIGRFLSDEEKSFDEDSELFMAVVNKYNKILEESDDEDFEINPPQYQKLLAVYAYFTKYAKSYGGEIEDIKLSPREELGDITVFIPNLYLECEEAGTLAKALSYGSALTIDSGDSGRFCLSMTIPNVFKEKGKPVREIVQSPMELGNNPIDDSAGEVLDKFEDDIKQVLLDGQYKVSAPIFRSLYRAVSYFVHQKMIDDSIGVEDTEVSPVGLFLEEGCARLEARFIVFQPMDDDSYQRFLDAISSATRVLITDDSDGERVLIRLTYDGLFVPA